MKAKKFFYAPSLVIALVCIGCSQHRIVSQREFLDETQKLKAGSKLILLDRSGKKHRCILVAPVRILPDSARAVVFNCKQDGEYHEFAVSLSSESNEVTEIRMRCNPEPGNIFIGGLLGAMGGAPLGVLIGEAANSKYDDSGAAEFYGVVIGTITGFIAGAVVSGNLPSNCVYVFDHKVGSINPIHHDER